MDYRIVFICMGNICRSPTAHGVFRQKLRDAGLLHRVVVDSAGTHNYHPGRPPDARAVAQAATRGVDLTDLRARVVRMADFSAADLLLYMDDNNLHHLQRRCPAVHHHKLRRLTAFCRFYKHDEVPDPYTGDDEDFELAMNLIDDACDGLLEHVRQVLNRREPLR